MFKVGTVCVGQNHTDGAAKYNGMECEIVGGLAERNCYSRVNHVTSKVMCYIVRWANGEELGCLPQYIRPKRPPANEWADRKVKELLAGMKTGRAVREPNHAGAAH